MNPGKVDCLRKWPAPAGCGAGVTKGEKLSLNLLYSNGTILLQEETDLLQSDAAKAGVQINPKSADFNTVISQVQPCTAKAVGTPTCNWQLGEYGGISQSTYPSGRGRCSIRAARSTPASTPTRPLDKMHQREHRGQHAGGLQGRLRT